MFDYCISVYDNRGANISRSYFLLHNQKINTIMKQILDAIECNVAYKIKTNTIIVSLH